MGGNLVLLRLAQDAEVDRLVYRILPIAMLALCAVAHSSGAAVKARHWAACAGLDRRAHNLLPRCTQLT
jgi:hypothetical protein